MVIGPSGEPDDPSVNDANRRHKGADDAERDLTGSRPGDAGQASDGPDDMCCPRANRGARKGERRERGDHAHTYRAALALW